MYSQVLTCTYVWVYCWELFLIFWFQRTTAARQLLFFSTPNWHPTAIENHNGQYCYCQFLILNSNLNFVDVLCRHVDIMRRTVEFLIDFVHCRPAHPWFSQGLPLLVSNFKFKFKFCGYVFAAMLPSWEEPWSFCLTLCCCPANSGLFTRVKCVQMPHHTGLLFWHKIPVSFLRFPKQDIYITKESIQQFGLWNKRSTHLMNCYKKENDNFYTQFIKNSKHQLIST